jgi:hypothetical protein
MKPIDLLEQFDKSNGAVGFIATYEFDPQFFERRILTKKSFGSATGGCSLFRGARRQRGARL